MLNIGKLAGVDSVDYYLSQAPGVEDYYFGNGEAPGQWTGTAASHVGLHGQVDAETLRRVLGGLDAAGAGACAAGRRRPATGRGRRACRRWVGGSPYGRGTVLFA